MSNNVLRFNTESALYTREIPFDGKDENGKDVVLFTANIEMTVSDIEEMQALKLSKPVSDKDIFNVLEILFKGQLEDIKKVLNNSKVRLSQLMMLVYQDLIEHQKKTSKSTQSMINRQQRRAK